MIISPAGDSQKNLDLILFHDIMIRLMVLDLVVDKIRIVRVF